MDDKRLTDIEIFLAEQGRILDDLNAEVLRLSKEVQKLSKQFEQLRSECTESLVKPLSEETRPPHY